MTLWVAAAKHNIKWIKFKKDNGIKRFNPRVVMSHDVFQIEFIKIALYNTSQSGCYDLSFEITRPTLFAPNFVMAISKKKLFI